MNTGRLVVRAVSALILVPVVLILIAVLAIMLSDRTNGTIVSSGEVREYLLYVPESYNHSTPTALVMSLHALALWPAAQQNTIQWNRVADQHGFIVVYPSGSGFPRVWRADPGAGLKADIAFISELIDTLQADYNIDATRIYANGLSNGGGMVFAISCLLSHRIAAVGLVAAAQTLPWSWCQDTQPMPMISFHGTADRMAPYAGGPSGDPIKRRVFPSVTAWTANWAQRNECAPISVTSVVATDTTRLEYRDCAEDAAVVLYTVEEGGHSWPGGEAMPEWMVGPTSDSVDASRRMWAFFSQHRLVLRQ